VARCLWDPATFSRFSRKRTCDKQTDRHYTMSLRQLFRASLSSLSKMSRQALLACNFSCNIVIEGLLEVADSCGRPYTVSIILETDQDDDDSCYRLLIGSDARPKQVCVFSRRLDCVTATSPLLQRYRQTEKQTDGRSPDTVPLHINPASRTIRAVPIILSFSMTLSDFQGLSRITSFFRCDCSYRII